MIEIVVDRTTLDGTVNLVGENAVAADIEEGSRILDARHAAIGSRAGSAAAGRHANLGGPAGRERRNVGRRGV